MTSLSPIDLWTIRSRRIRGMFHAGWDPPVALPIDFLGQRPVIPSKAISGLLLVYRPQVETHLLLVKLTMNGIFYSVEIARRYIIHHAGLVRRHHSTPKVQRAEIRPLDSDHVNLGRWH